MTEKEQLEWCIKNRATVWFLRKGVKIKPQDFSSAIQGENLQRAIESVELFRRHRKEAQASVGNEEGR